MDTRTRCIDYSCCFWYFVSFITLHNIFIMDSKCHRWHLLFEWRAVTKKLLSHSATIIQRGKSHDFILEWSWKLKIYSSCRICDDFQNLSLVRSMNLISHSSTWHSNHQHITTNSHVKKYTYTTSLCPLLLCHWCLFYSRPPTRFFMLCFSSLYNNRLP